MSTPAISDYITKQIFIEKNIVTYRSLSRQFSLHVNTAKNELATYHHNAPYQSQNSCATFLISGTMKMMVWGKGNSREDVDMDQTEAFDNVEKRDGLVEDDSDEVSQTTVLLVNEKDLEDAKAKYHVIHSLHVYSLAPAPLIDAALICDCTESVRSIDRSKGEDWAATVGRVIFNGIKTGPPRKRKPPLPPQAPVAGPSKSKPTPASEPAATKTELVKTEAKKKQAPSSVLTSDKAEEKNNTTGKFNFFTKSKDKTEVKLNEAPAKSMCRRKSRASLKSESSAAMDSEAEREARALMDIDDDQVERVSHAPSTVVSEFEDQSETDSAPVKLEQDDGDVDMADDTAAQRPKKRKAKTIIPVGRNGLKKRKVVRTRTRKDNGYIYKEDYTDWESVDDEEPEPEPERKGKSKSNSTAVKKEATEDAKPPSVTPDEMKRKDSETARKAEPVAKPSRRKAKTSGNVKTQKGLMNFFGPSKKT